MQHSIQSEDRSRVSGVFGRRVRLASYAMAWICFVYFGTFFALLACTVSGTPSPS